MKVIRELRARGHDRGAAAVEFALVLPILAAFLFAIVDFGLAFMNQIQVTSVAREGARYSVVTPNATGAQVQTRAILAAPGMNGLTVTLVRGCPTGAGGSATTEVRANQVHDWLLLGPWMGLDKDLKATAVMQCGG